MDFETLVLCSLGGKRGVMLHWWPLWVMDVRAVLLFLHVFLGVSLDVCGLLLCFVVHFMLFECSRLAIWTESQKIWLARWVRQACYIDAVANLSSTKLVSWLRYFGGLTFTMPAGCLVGFCNCVTLQARVYWCIMLINQFLFYVFQALFCINVFFCFCIYFAEAVGGEIVHLLVCLLLLVGLSYLCMVHVIALS